MAVLLPTKTVEEQSKRVETNITKYAFTVKEKVEEIIKILSVDTAEDRKKKLHNDTHSPQPALQDLDLETRAEFVNYLCQRDHQ